MRQLQTSLLIQLVIYLENRAYLTPVISLKTLDVIAKITIELHSKQRPAC